MLRKLLLISGIIASLIYVGSDILAAMLWYDYSYSSKSVSELRAIGAPTRYLLLPILYIYAMFEIAFGFGIWRIAEVKHGLRLTGVLLMCLGVVDLFAPFFPMHLGGTMHGDAMHLIITGVTVLLILLIVGFGSTAFGLWFRIYSIVTIGIVLLFGALAGVKAPQIDAHLPTPWLGIEERINIYGYMLWLIVFAICLLREERKKSFANAGTNK